MRESIAVLVLIWAIVSTTNFHCGKGQDRRECENYKGVHNNAKHH